MDVMNAEIITRRLQRSCAGESGYSPRSIECGEAIEGRIHKR